MGATSAGLADITSALGTTFWLAVGTGTTAYSKSQTALVTEVSDSGLARAAATVTRVTTTDANDTLQAVYTWTASGTKTLTEVGQFDAASTGTMYSRSVLATTRPMVSGDQYTLTNKIIFAA